jgi:hypothetical protein
MEKVDADSVLRGMNMMSKSGFASVENAAKNQGRDRSGLSLDGTEFLWEEGKKTYQKCRVRFTSANVGPVHRADHHPGG